MNHNSKQIKVRIFPDKLKYFHLSPDSSDSDSEWKDSDDEKSSPWPAFKRFLEPKNWILEGNRLELEKQLKDALGGDLWTENMIPCGKGWYQDMYIIRLINSGNAEYIQ